MKQALLTLLLWLPLTIHAKPIGMKQLNMLCNKIESLLKVDVCNTADSMSAQLSSLQLRSEYLSFLSNVYSEKQDIRYTQMKTDEGELLRIGEGLYQIVTNAIGSYPDNIKERVYYFLNGELVKLSIHKGIVNYNSSPVFFYSITVCTLELYYRNSKLSKKTYFTTTNGNRQTLSKKTMIYRDIDGNAVEKLKEDAYLLYNAYRQE